MKVLLGTCAWMLCTILVILPTLATPKDRLQYYTKTWKLETNKPETYSNLIASLRTEVSVGKVCEIPVTAISPEKTKAFVLVEITNMKNKVITLAFRASNVYYVGFKDELNGVTRANYLKEDFNELVKNKDLFSDAKIKTQLPHGGNYNDLEGVAKVKRYNLKLGISSLSTLIDKIYGSDYNGTKKPEDIGQYLARFALVAIQMIPEATRFKYIEENVTDLGTNEGTFYPDPVFLRLENSWDPFSKLIHNSSPGCKPVKSPNFPQWDDIKTQVALLKFKGSRLNVPPFMEGIFGNNDDGYDALQFIMYQFKYGLVFRMYDN